MPDTYPYTISNNKLEAFFNKIRTAARPDRLSQQVLKHWGFTGSNDRALIPIMRALRFIDDNGVPTELYGHLKGDTDWRNLLGNQIRELYSDLYATNTEIHDAPDGEIKGVLSRITGKDATLVNRYFGTFKGLATIARFDGRSDSDRIGESIDAETEKPSAPTVEVTETPMALSRDTSFHYNIQIHLPATNDISVYNAIFKSLRDHLMI